MEPSGLEALTPSCHGDALAAKLSPYFSKSKNIIQIKDFFSKVCYSNSNL